MEYSVSGGARRMTGCLCCGDLLTARPSDPDARQCIHCGRMVSVAEAGIPVYNMVTARLEYPPVVARPAAVKPAAKRAAA